MPVSNLIALLPGHLLLLLALTHVIDRGGAYVYLWIALPIVTLAYDISHRWAPDWRLAVSIPILLYAILWASLITLLERIVVLGGESAGNLSS